MATLNLGKVVGDDGQTPYIGENGNWWTGDTDTGVKAQGPAGANGTGSGTVTGVKVGDETYEPDEAGVVELPEMGGGAGVPDGGTTGQILIKQSDANGDAIWKTPTAQDVGALTSNGTAADASKLGGRSASEYMQASNVLDSLESVTANTAGGMVAGALAVKELKNSLEKTDIGIASTSVGNVDSNYSCIINGVKLISLKITGINASANTGTTLCKLDTTFSGEVPVAISTNFDGKVSAWIRSNGELAINANPAMSNNELRIIGIGW
ncbi:MAG: hypothetical protein IKJ11_11025 [Clostridia bacterium]|nr:hypothetical protein [Clostridia bacterium]